MFGFPAYFIVMPSLLLVATSIQTSVHHGEVVKPQGSESQPQDTERPVKVDKPHPAPPQKTGKPGPKPPPLKPPTKKASKPKPAKKNTVETIANPQKVGKPENIPVPVKIGKPGNHPSPTKNSSGVNKAATAPAGRRKVGEPRKVSAGVSAATTGEIDTSCMDSNRFPCASMVTLCDNNADYAHIKDFCRKTCGLCSTYNAAETESIPSVPKPAQLPTPSAQKPAQFGDIAAPTAPRNQPRRVGPAMRPLGNAIGPAMPNDTAPVIPYVPVSIGGEPFNKTGARTMANVPGPPATAAINSKAEDLGMPCEDNMLLPCSKLASKCNNTNDGARIRNLCPMSCGLCPSTPTMPAKVDEPVKRTNVSTAVMAPAMDSLEANTTATAKTETCMDAADGINMDGVMVNCADMVYYCNIESAFSPMVKAKCRQSCGTCPTTDASPPSEQKVMPIKVGEPTNNKGKANQWAQDFGTPAPPIAEPTKQEEAPNNTVKEMPVTVAMPAPAPDTVPLRAGGATDSSQPCMDLVGGVKLDNILVPCPDMVQYCNIDSTLTSTVKLNCPKTCGLCAATNPSEVNAAAMGDSSGLKKFDMDNNGFITRNEIDIILNTGHTGEKWTEEDITGIVQGGDENKDGQLTIDELEHWMNA